MTPVGVALIVGGITTLIVLRAALFRSARKDQRAGGHGEARRRAGTGAAGRDDGAANRKGRRGRAARKAAAAGPQGAAHEESEMSAWLGPPLPADEPADRSGRTGTMVSVPGPDAVPLDAAGAGGPDSRGWPTTGSPGEDRAAPDDLAAFASAVDGIPAVPDPEPAADEHVARRGWLFRRLVTPDSAVGPAPSGAVPTDVRPVPPGPAGTLDGTDEPGEPADRAGDPELDIDQDLDRVADEAERSRALGLPGLDLPDAEAPRAGYDAELSGPFDAIGSSSGTGTFASLYRDAPLDDPDETGFVPVTEVAAGPGRTRRADPHHGDRVEGWIRPEYQEEPRPVSGEYWTPVPVGSYEAGYGWPTPVERLPEVPPYPSPAGFDAPEGTGAEPTGRMPQWPPAHPDDRVELPRSWSHAGEPEPTHRTVVDHDEPPAWHPADPVAEPAATGAPTGRFGGTAGHREQGPSAHGWLAEPMPAADDRVFLGAEGLVLASNPYAHEAGRPDRGFGVWVPEDAGEPDGWGRPAAAGPQSRGPGIDGPYAAREESLEGPVWKVPDLPEAALPDLTWCPEATPPAPVQVDQPRGHRDQGRARPGESRTRRDQVRARQDQPRTRRDQARARQDEPRGRRDQVRARQDQPRTRRDQARARQDQPQTRSDQPRIRADQPGARPGQSRVRPEQARVPDPVRAQEQRRGHLDQPRGRPRPRPRPGHGQPEWRSTVYLSRHAAGPG